MTAFLCLQKDEKIALFYMGGTFGCIGEPLAPMPYDQFLPQLEKVIPHT